METELCIRQASHYALQTVPAFTDAKGAFSFCAFARVLIDLFVLCGFFFHGFTSDPWAGETDSPLLTPRPVFPGRIGSVAQNSFGI